MSMGIVQKFSRLSSWTGPWAQLVQTCFFAGVCLIGCAPANVKSQPATFARQPELNGTYDATQQTHWDFIDVAGTRTPIGVGLPKAGNWEFDDQHTPWWVASNTTLELKLEAKLWPERRQVTTEECLTDLRRWRPETQPGPNAHEVRSERSHLPEGFDSQLSVTVGKIGGSANEGVLTLLVGADVSRCFAFLATLTPKVPLSEAELLTRTAVVTEGIIPKIRLRSIDQRVESALH